MGACVPLLRLRPRLGIGAVPGLASWAGADDLDKVPYCKPGSVSVPFVSYLFFSFFTAAVGDQLQIHGELPSGFARTKSLKL